MKHINLHKIKSLYSYTAPELSALLNRQEETIYRWIKNEGLELIDEKQPIMVFGIALINFLKHRQSKKKARLTPCQIYCCKCKKPKTPAQGTIKIEEYKKVFLFKGDCPDSGTRMNRIISKPHAETLLDSLDRDMPISRLTGSDNTLANRMIEETKMHPRYCATNERIKWKYFKYERQVNGKSTKSLDKIVRELRRFEQFTQFRDFKEFNEKLAVDFKQHMTNARNEKGEKYSLSTISSTLRSFQNFLRWLSMQPGYKKHINSEHIEYLNLSERDMNGVRAIVLKKYPSLKQINKVIFSSTPSNVIEKRNQAIIAFLICTGVRAGALVGLKLKHLDFNRRVVFQDPKDVQTKFGKVIYTKLLPVGEDIQQLVLNWYQYLKSELNFDDNSPLFPRSCVEHIGNFTVKRNVLSNRHYSTGASINKLVKAEFLRAGEPPFPPHRFRDTISEMGRKLCCNAEELMAWGANLGHKNPITTFSVYGALTPEQQLEVLERLEKAQDRKHRPEEIESYIEAIIRRVNLENKDS